MGGGRGGQWNAARTGEVTDAVGNTTSMTVNGTGLGFGYGGTNPGFYNQLLSAHGSTYVRSILGLALSSQVVGGKTIRDVTHPSGVNIGYVAPEGQAWFLTDRLGTVIGLASNSGSLIASYSYDPTGIPRATVETGTVAGYNIHRYAGGLLDRTTGLTRFGVRWYDPATGRFTTPDPSGKEKNTYLYAGGNALNLSDPSGMDSNDGTNFVVTMLWAAGSWAATSSFWATMGLSAYGWVVIKGITEDWASRPWGKNPYAYEPPACQWSSSWGGCMGRPGVAP